MANIRKIEQINETVATALDAAGLNTVAKLLDAASMPGGRDCLRQLTGAADEELGEWLLRADLFRLKGVSSGYADLLVAVGVNSVADLGTREGRPLHREMAVINRERRLVRQLPPVSHVERWVEEAKGKALEPVDAST